MSLELHALTSSFYFLLIKKPLLVTNWLYVIFQLIEKCTKLDSTAAYCLDGKLVNWDSTEDKIDKIGALNDVSNGPVLVFSSWV